MPITLNKVDGEPIVIATMTGYISADEIAEMYEETLTHITDETPYLYRITDTTRGDSSFPDMFKAMTSVKDTPGSSDDHRIRKVYFVGTSVWLKTATQMFAKLGINVPIYPSVELAIEHIKLVDSGQENIDEEAV